MHSTQKKKVVSGIQPSGRPHFGNYFGAMKQFIDLQDTYDLHIFIAEYHAMTTIQDPVQLKTYIHELILDYLALGLDPEKITMYRQSAITELHELTWIFNCLVTVPWLERAHAYKDKVARGIEASVALFDYPVLMAADILLADADIVAVGKDQVQHIEMAREIARKMKAQYDVNFKEPQEQLNEETAVVPGTDGQKMSKSYNNTIPLFASDAEIEKAIMSIVTDSKTPEEAKDPETCHVFALHRLVTKEPELSEIRRGYTEGGLGYGDAKKLLLKNYLALVEPMRAQRRYYEENPGIVRQILDEGEGRMQTHARKVMQDLRLKVGLS